MEQALASVPFHNEQTEAPQVPLLTSARVNTWCEWEWIYANMALKSTALQKGGGLALGNTHPELCAHPALFYHFLCAALDSRHTPEGGRTLFPLVSGGSDM